VGDVEINRDRCGAAAAGQGLGGEGINSGVTAQAGRDRVGLRHEC
jgi:hypothetical protein